MTKCVKGILAVLAFWSVIAVAILEPMMMMMTCAIVGGFIVSALIFSLVGGDE